MSSRYMRRVGPYKCLYCDWASDAAAPEGAQADALQAHFQSNHADKRQPKTPRNKCPYCGSDIASCAQGTYCSNPNCGYVDGSYFPDIRPTEAEMEKFRTYTRAERDASIAAVIEASATFAEEEADKVPGCDSDWPRRIGNAIRAVATLEQANALREYGLKVERATLNATAVGIAHNHADLGAGIREALSIVSMQERLDELESISWRDGDIYVSPPPKMIYDRIIELRHKLAALEINPTKN